MLRKIFNLFICSLLFFLIGSLSVNALTCRYNGSEEYTAANNVVNKLIFTFKVNMSNGAVEYSGPASWTQYNPFKSFDRVKVLNQNIGLSSKCLTEIFYIFEDSSRTIGNQTKAWTRTFTLFGKQPSGVEEGLRKITLDGDGSVDPTPVPPIIGSKTCVYSGFDVTYKDGKVEYKSTATGSPGTVTIINEATFFSVSKDGKINCPSCVWLETEAGRPAIYNLYNYCPSNAIGKRELKEERDSIGDNGGSNRDAPDSGDWVPIDCSDFTDEHGNIFKDIWNIIRIVIPILLIVLGTADFAKASFSADEDTMKKTQTKFIRRIIAAVILFVLPFIVQVILSLAYNSGIPISTPIYCIFG